MPPCWVSRSTPHQGAGRNARDLLHRMHRRRSGLSPARRREQLHLRSAQLNHGLFGHYGPGGPISNRHFKASIRRFKASNSRFEASIRRLEASNSRLEPSIRRLEAWIRRIEASNEHPEASVGRIHLSKRRLEASRPPFEASRRSFEASNPSLEPSRGSSEVTTRSLAASRSLAAAGGRLFTASTGHPSRTRGADPARFRWRCPAGESSEASDRRRQPTHDQAQSSGREFTARRSPSPA